MNPGVIGRLSGKTYAQDMTESGVNDSLQRPAQLALREPVEIKIPQRMVNLPDCPAGLFRNVLLAMLALVTLALLLLFV